MSSFEEYVNKYQTARMERRDGILQVTLHTEGQSLRWGFLPHGELPEAFHDIGADGAARHSVAKERPPSGLFALEARPGRGRHPRSVPVRGAGQLDDAPSLGSGLSCRPAAARPRNRRRRHRANRAVPRRRTADLISREGPQ